MGYDDREHTEDKVLDCKWKDRDAKGGEWSGEYEWQTVMKSDMQMYDKGMGGAGRRQDKELVFEKESNNKFI